jgi:LmbE family N-acetylglucosaminyl deacetylase
VQVFTVRLSGMREAQTVLHISAHPDDELTGAPAALFALRDAGFDIVNLACGLGRSEQHARRTAELREACRRADFGLELPPKPIALSSSDDPVEARHELMDLIAKTATRLQPVLIVSPQPHDRHRAHELVARAVRDVVVDHRAGNCSRWWMWGLWGDLPLPTIEVAFDERRLDEITGALEAHEQELGRNDYRRLIRGRGEMNASRGPELVFGFGSSGEPGPYVELLTEAVFTNGRWLLGTPRRLDPTSAMSEPPSGVEIGDWLYLETVTQCYGSPGALREGARFENEAQRDRIWDHRLHEDSQFNQRLNFFLIAEAMLVVAAAQVLSSDTPRPWLGAGISAVGLGLTVVWMAVNRRQIKIMRHIQDRAKNALPEFRKHYETRPKGHSTRWLSDGIPVIIAVVWVIILAVAIGDLA